jgi:hypothetical protein
MAEFKSGQRVGFLYEKGYGIIRSISGNKATVEDETGFDRIVPLNELVFIHSEQYGGETSSLTKEDLEPEMNYRVVPERTGQRKPNIVWEVDLHIEELLESHSGLSNTDILIKQMSEFKGIFKKAKKEGIHKLIVIHGVGEGVLKNEVRTFLMNQEQIEYYDAEYSEYGKGATAIDFHPNWV